MYEVSLVQFNEADAKAIITQCFEIDKEQITQFWSLEQWKEILGADQYLLFVLKHKNKIIGFDLLHYLESDFAHLLKIVLNKEYQNQGLAKQLLEESMLKLRKMDIPSIYLEVESDNHQALKFYKKMNFVEVAIKKKYYSNGKDACAMQLVLD